MHVIGFMKIPGLNCTLIDLSRTMLERAKERVAAVTNGGVEIIQADIVETELQENHYDIVLAAAVLRLFCCLLRCEVKNKKTSAYLSNSEILIVIQL